MTTRKATASSLTHHADRDRGHPQSAPPSASTTDGCELCEPPLALGERRTLLVRHAGVDDLDALARLYQRFSPTDLRRRFFTSGPPSESFVRHWMSIEADGGLSLVVEVREDDRTHLIAEAGYAPLADGDCELGIAVDPAHRGWLGPWLLDSLFAHARASGVHNIQALVLSENEAMLAMARRRGYAVLDHPDFTTVRLTMSTSGDVPSWPTMAPRPRIVVESNRTRFRAEDELREAGFAIAVCQGPCRPSGRCPVLEGERCPLLAGADLAIVDLPPDDPMAEKLVGAEHRLHPDLRVITGHDRSDDGTSHRLSTAEILAEVQDLRPSDGNETPPCD